MALFVLGKLILQTRMVSHPVGQDFWSDPSSTILMCANSEGLVRLRRCAGSPEPSLVSYVIITGDSHYVDFAYLDTITYVEVIFHSQYFFSIYLCISTPSMSKTVNMKQRVSRADFSCPRHIFYYICYVLCRSQKSALTRVPYCLFWLCICIN